MTRPHRHSLSGAILLILASALIGPVTVLAHNPGGVAGGFASGFMHPLTGIDHILAMVAVGIWGAQLGAPAIWALPVAFPLVMSIGGALGIRGIFLPGVEIGTIVGSNHAAVRPNPGRRSGRKIRRTCRSPSPV